MNFHIAKFSHIFSAKKKKKNGCDFVYDTFEILTLR